MKAQSRKINNNNAREMQNDVIIFTNNENKLQIDGCKSKRE